MEEQKFKIGEVVHESVRPGQRLVITRVDGRLYHCKPYGDMDRPAIVYAERDLSNVDKKP